MGERGPLPSPTARKREREPAATMRVIVSAPAMPRTLKGEARAEWRRVVPELQKMGLLASVDRSVLIRYCGAWADWVEIDEQLQSTGRLIKGRRDGVVRNPLWLLRSDTEATLSDLGKQLGLTPAARVRAGVAHRQPTPDLMPVDEADVFPDVADPRILLRAVK